MWHGINPPVLPVPIAKDAEGANVLGGTHCHAAILKRAQDAYGEAFMEPPVAILDSQPEKFRDTAVRNAVVLTEAPLLGTTDEDYMDVWHLMQERPMSSWIMVGGHSPQRLHALINK